MVAVERELSETPAPAAVPTADAIPLKLRRHGGTPRQVLALTVVGTLALALFASRDLPSWSDRLGDCITQPGQLRFIWQRYEDSPRKAIRKRDRGDR